MGLFNFIFSRLCRVVFDRVDRDKNGKLEVRLVPTQDGCDW